MRGEEARREERTPRTWGRRRRIRVAGREMRGMMNGREMPVVSASRKEEAGFQDDLEE
jgi:hypothetical protein